MRRWIREVWPSPRALVVIAIIYVVVAFSTQLLYTAAGGAGPYSEAWIAAIACLGFFSAVYAMYRVFGFHPVFHEGYLAWLRQTPWKYGKPLPGGPLHLVSQDVVFVGLLTALAWIHRPEFALLIPALFLGFLFGSWTISFKVTKHRKHAYLMAFLFSGLIPFWNSPVALSIVFALMCAVVLHGIRETLVSFHDWSGLKEEVFKVLKKSGSQNDKVLGWPYDRLAPTLSNVGTFRESLAISTLVTWWAFLVAAYIWPGDAGTLGFAVFAGAFLGPVTRIMVFLAGYSAPLSLRGRLVTGQWIIPGFDIVWLAPALMFLLSGTFCLIFLIWNLPFSVGVASIVFCSMMIGLKCPPDLNEWKLTGNHHIVKGVTLNGAELQGTQ